MKNPFFLMLPFYCLTNSGCTAQAQSSTVVQGKSVYSGNKLIGHEPGNFGDDEFYSDWTSEPLSGNNKPFHDIRLSIRSINKTPGLLKTKMSVFETEAKAKPYDAIAQFRWVFADWVEHNYKNSPLIKWREALFRPISPKTYDYARLRFLITAEAATGAYMSDKRLKELGIRLLKIDPSDEFVAYWLRHIKGYSSSVKDKWDNVRASQIQAKARPQDANVQGDLGGAYRDLWIVTKNHSYGNMAIMQYKRYLQLAPPSASFRKDAQFWITAITKNQAHWDKQKAKSSR